MKNNKQIIHIGKNVNKLKRGNEDTYLFLEVQVVATSFTSSFREVVHACNQVLILSPYSMLSELVILTRPLQARSAHS